MRLGHRLRGEEGAPTPARGRVCSGWQGRAHIAAQPPDGSHSRAIRAEGRVHHSCPEAKAGPLRRRTRGLLLRQKDTSHRRPGRLLGIPSFGHLGFHGIASGGLESDMAGWPKTWPGSSPQCSASSGTLSLRHHVTPLGPTDEVRSGSGPQRSPCHTNCCRWRRLSSKSEPRGAASDEILGPVFQPSLWS